MRGWGGAGREPVSPALAGRFLTAGPLWKPSFFYLFFSISISTTDAWTTYHMQTVRLILLNHGPHDTPTQKT